MSENEITEILCFPGCRKNYAVDFSCVVEISYDFKISKVPCMPQDFEGVCSYKGVMIPVIRVEEAPKTDTEDQSRVIVVIIKHQKYLLGIRLSREPYIISYTDAEKITNPLGVAASERWGEKGIYRYGDTLFSVIDVEKTLEGMVFYP